ncbi:MAG: hypothetical protein ABI624_13995 [Casimicrobiaceae bacterium]
MTPATLFAIVTNAVMPAFTAFKYAQFALSPDQFDETYPMALAILAVAQLPLVILGAAFAGVSYIEGPAWRRAAVYVGIVALFGVLSGMGKFLFDQDIGPILAWAIAMQILILAFVGPQSDLARARIDAVMGDGVNLLIMTPFVTLIAIGVYFALKDLAGLRSLDLQLTDIAWAGACYFALRAFSAAYVFTPGFEKRRKGFFQRAWIERLVTPNRKGESIN